MSLDDDLRLLDALTERYSNHGRWGSDDEAGTLNFITAEKVQEAVRLVRHGRVLSLALPFGPDGPQEGFLGRFNPMHFMTRDGTDVYARESNGLPRGVGGSDDVLIMPTAAATHWDSLAHIFFRDTMWNGYDARLVSSAGAERNAITSYKAGIVGRAVLLDIPRFLGIDWCETGQAVTSEELTACADAQGVTVGRGDIVLLRFGEMARCRASGSWDGYAGGNSAGLDLETLGWIHEREVAAVASDTWGVEVRPNATPHINQPWHRVAIPGLGLAVGEMFDLDDLAEICAQQQRHEMFISAAPLAIEGSVNGPANPLVIL